jgi:hypothetical protein
MARLSFRTLLVLLAAAALNVLVAWACVVWHVRYSDAPSTGGMMAPASLEMQRVWQVEFGPGIFVTRHDEARHIDAPRNAEFGSNLFMLGEFRQTSPGCARVQLHDMMRQLPPGMRITLAGWPRPALTCSDVTRPRGGGARSAWPVNIGRTPRPEHLPLRPLWSGMLINMALYACTIAAVWIFVHAARRALRARLRRCLACGYDRRASASPACPECGALGDPPAALLSAAPAIRASPAPR